MVPSSFHDLFGNVSSHLPLIRVFVGLTLPETGTSPLKSRPFPKEIHLPTINFQGFLAVSFREGIQISPKFHQTSHCQVSINQNSHHSFRFSNHLFLPQKPSNQILQLPEQKTNMAHAPFLIVTPKPSKTPTQKITQRKPCTPPTCRGPTFFFPKSENRGVPKNHRSFCRLLGSAGAGSAATASPRSMARAVFCARALGLSKVLCSMDTINSYGAEAAEVVFFCWERKPSRVFFSGRLNGGFRAVVLLSGLGGNADLM